jgi:hypothetical protein
VTYLIDPLIINKFGVNNLAQPQGLIELKTITGRIFRFKENNNVKTHLGPVKANRISKEHKILIEEYPLNETSIMTHDNIIVSLILDENSFIQGEWAHNLSKEKRHLLNKDLIQLKKVNLLPLRTDNPKLPIIARLLGSIITDGSIPRYEVIFSLGSYDDANEICKDIECLGFKPNKITHYTGTYKSNERKVTHQGFLTRKGGAFVRFMIALGAPVSRKSMTNSYFPQWVHKSPKIVKREFLAALLGGDGPAPWFYKRTRRKESYKITFTDFFMHKHINYVNSLISFFKHLKTLFEEFSVDINRIKTKELPLSKNKVKVALQFSKSKDNILQLCQNVGYRYCKEKSTKALFISEYLRYHKSEVVKRKKAKKNVIMLYNEGFSRSEIAERLKISPIIIGNIIQRRHKNFGGSQVIPQSSWTIKQFLCETNADIKNGRLYVPLKI